MLLIDLHNQEQIYQDYIDYRELVEDAIGDAHAAGEDRPLPTSLNGPGSSVNDPAPLSIYEIAREVYDRLQDE